MGVQEPVEDAFAEVPATPPGVQDLGSDDDLFAQIVEDKKPKLTTVNNDLFKGILPVLPYKGNFDFIDVQDEKDIWGLQSFTNKKKDKQCPTCMEDVTRDLKKLEQFVEKCKKESDDLKAENECLKKELEELKKHLKKNDSYCDTNVGVEISISDQSEGKLDVLLRNSIFENCDTQKSDTSSTLNRVPELKNNYGITSFSISLPKEMIRSPSINEELTNVEPKSRKSVAQLRKEFFEKEFRSEQKVFISQNYLEIEPEEKKDTFRSRLTVKVNPKQRIAEIISKLTSLSSGPQRIPKDAPISMFQRFERSKIVWQNDFKEKLVLKRNK